MMRNRSYMVAASLCLGVMVFASVLRSQEQGLTPDDIIAIRTASNVQISPDGKAVVFQVNRARRSDERPGSAIAELWTVAASGGEPRRFTFNEKSDRTPAWSPDGRRIAFLSQRGEATTTQVWAIPFDGGEAKQLTNAENAVVRFAWSPDGKQLAFTMVDPRSKEELQAEKEGRDWTVVDKNARHTRLYALDVETGAQRMVSQADLTVHDFDWSPDGRQFVLAAAETPTVDDSYMRQRLWTVPAEGGHPRKLVETEGKLGNPRWSPDGKWIAWLGAVELKDSYAGSVFVVQASGGGATNLTAGYEGTATHMAWVPGKSGKLAVTAIERQATVSLALSVPGGKREPLVTSTAIFNTQVPGFSRDGRWVAVAAHTPTHPFEVYIGETNGRPMRRLTHLNPHLGRVKFADQEVIAWKSVDDWTIEGVLVKPLGYHRGQKYPLILQPHGGPESADLNGWKGSYSQWGQMLAARGYMVLYPNYRGSIGRGPAFAMADQQDLMGKEFEDMVAGIDHLVKQGMVDPERVGVGGGSYGGYTSAWAATYGSDRFKAAIPWMGISNWHSMTGTSDIFYENSTVHWNLEMYDHFDKYWERSPLAHIHKAKTPSLIIHGAIDPRVPIGQSHELYTALKWKGVPVEFVIYPREGHGVSERAHQIDFMARVLRWFETYVKPATVQP